MSDIITFRIYPVFEKGSLKEDRHNRPLGIVDAASPEAAVQRAIDGRWVKQYDDLDGYKGEFRAAN